MFVGYRYRSRDQDVEEGEEDSELADGELIKAASSDTEDNKTARIMTEPNKKEPQIGHTERVEGLLRGL
jgi:hypothetical protein